VANGVDPIADDELLYRRIPSAWQDTVSGRPSTQAFAPHKSRDLTGLSLARAKYKTIQEAELGQPGKIYFVAVLLAGDVRQAGIAVEPRPLPDDPGHCEFPDLRADTCKDSITLERQGLLVDLCLRVEGPFATLST
jgi:hypothetical protein